MSHPMPTGVVGLMFTDIAGHTKMWDRLGDDFMPILEAHNAIIRAATAKHNGYEVKTEGDSFMLAFAKASDAILCAIEAQVALANHSWPESVGEIRVRMGIHTGEPQVSGDDYFGPPVIRASRLCAAGHGGQILISAATRELILEKLPMAIEFLDLGLHRLNDLRRPEQIFQVNHPDLPQKNFPPLKTLDIIPNNLPVQLTSFVGRETEIHRLSELLAKESIRLVTLTGPGGIGKTRLSIQAAAQQLENFPDGVWFIDLASLTHPEQVITTIASTLSVQLQPKDDPQKQVIDALAQKRLLLILDNFEHLTEAASLINDILHGTAFLRCLVTSRELLQISGEQTFVVPSLSMPAANADTETLSQYESVRLFIERAQAVKPDFELTSQNAATVIAICRHLGGISLAIELAAARVRGMTVGQILDRLSQQIDLLATRSRDVPLRHRTLRNAIDWSYELLAPDEQQLFAQLSVFSGGFFLEAAEAISDVPDTFELIFSLHEKSLLTAEEVMEQTRYQMLDLIRAYAKEKLGEAIALKKAHAVYYLARVQDYDQKLTGTEQSVALSEIALELENFRAAMDWARVQEEWKLVGELGVALSEFFYIRGLWSEGMDRLRQAEEALRSLQDDRLLATALHERGTFYEAQGDYETARNLYTESLRIQRSLKDNRGILKSLNNLGEIARLQGGREEAKQLYTESLQIARALQDKQGVAYALNNLGIIARSEGALEEANRLYTESLHIFRALRDTRGAASALNNLGVIATQHGAYGDARKFFTESLKIARRLDNRWGIAYLLNNLGDIAQSEGLYQEARRLLTESLQICRELQSKQGLAHALNNLGQISVQEGSYEEAGQLFTESLQIRRELGNKNEIAESLYQLSALAEAESNSAQAVSLLLSAVYLYEEVQTPKSEDAIKVREALARIEKKIGAEPFEKLKREAEAMSVDARIELTLT
ncbi:MAG: tetratricopeptide repeat protein [Candidatus Poribacteria bacterium]|nr:tetratricopeptide repeat protein [Candidatus Poribacteria bacterium]